MGQYDKDIQEIAEGMMHRFVGLTAYAVDEIETREIPPSVADLAILTTVSNLFLISCLRLKLTPRKIHIMIDDMYGRVADQLKTNIEAFDLVTKMMDAAKRRKNGEEE